MNIPDGMESFWRDECPCRCGVVRKASLWRLNGEKKSTIVGSRESGTQENIKPEAKASRQWWGWRVLRIERTIHEIGMYGKTREPYRLMSERRSGARLRSTCQAMAKSLQVVPQSMPSNQYRLGMIQSKHHSHSHMYNRYWRQETSRPLITLLQKTMKFLLGWWSVNEKPKW